MTDSDSLRTTKTITDLEFDESPHAQAQPWDEYAKEVATDWQALLVTDPRELAVQKFLEQHPAMLPGGFNYGPGGNHGAELGGIFREARLEGLARDRRPDFMWITRSSDLITPVCIEIEQPSKPWFTAQGIPTASFTQARNQITQWKAWFAQNETSFRSTYLDNQYAHRTLRPQYILIYGRHSEFELTGRHKNPNELLRHRAQLAAFDERFMSFDSLALSKDLADTLTLNMAVNGPEVYRISRAARLGPMDSEHAHRMRSIDGALARSTDLDIARKTYLKARWEYLRDRGDESASGQTMFITPVGRQD